MFYVFAPHTANTKPTKIKDHAAIVFGQSTRALSMYESHLIQHNKVIGSSCLVPSLSGKTQMDRTTGTTLSSFCLVRHDSESKKHYDDHESYLY